MLKIKLLFVALLSFMAAGFAQTVVTGTLLGFDGKPMIKEKVILKSPQFPSVDKDIKSVTPDKNGKFKIQVDSAGISMLYFVGVDHEPYQMALYVDKPEKINVNVRLKAYNYLNDFSKAALLGNFNEWLDAKAILMTKNSDGTYSAEIDSKSDTVIYRLKNVADGDLVEGTQSDAFVYDLYYGYNSLIFSKPGKVKITFDPNKLLRSDAKRKVSFSDPHSFAARFAHVYNEILENRAAAQKALKDFMSAGKDIRAFKYDWSKAVKSYETQIKAEKNKIIKDEMLIGYLELATARADLDSNVAKQALADLTPDSFLWSIDPEAIDVILKITHANLPMISEYLDKVANENSSVSVKTYTLYDLFMIAKYSGKNDEASKYYNILVNKYGDTEIGKMIKERFTDVQHVKVGSPMPEFSFVSLDDSSKVITNQSLKGKNYMIDFWATWCGPCVGQMKTLNDAYEKYKGKNFEMISVSFDRSAEDVMKFRQGEWKMPWFNSYVSANDQQKIMKDFDIIGIPNPILVNDKGIVVALQGDLRDESLDKTLNNLLDTGNK